MQGQDVLTCPTIANNHQKTSTCEVFLFEMMRDRTSIAPSKSFISIPAAPE
ncbi:MULTISPECIES: hypothetical protein [unclassified Microcoleus]|uniref:hypothetical protein n=1 Tax=unclassified Microcoleus TaxID=2642155 RepID=UPI002FD1E513